MKICCFWSKFGLFAHLSKEEIQFSKIKMCHFLLYIAKYHHAKKKKKGKSTEWILRKMHHTQTGRQMNWSDFIGPLSQRWRLIMFFGNLRIKFSLKLFGLTIKNQHKKKEYNQQSSVFKEFKKQ